jgi:riboflavin kinase/FMN adenylyltransferase
LTTDEFPVATATALAWTDRGLQGGPPRGCVLAVGNFDGIHLGHQALLAEGRALAATMSRPLGLLTFEPHPRSLFRPEQPVFRLTPPPIKRELARDCGCCHVLELAFNRDVAALSATGFIDDLLLAGLDAAALVVGSDFAFGKARSGDVATLTAAFGSIGRPVRALDPVHDASGQVISSSRIRQALADGDVAAANLLLGRRWTIRAEVVHGDKRGRLLGFPTANMVLPADNKLRHGIYAVEVRLDDAWHKAVASFGRRPTFDDGAPRLETFVFDFAGDLYGKVLDVRFAGFVRAEQRFESPDALIGQMQRDCAEARRQLG